MNALTPLPFNKRPNRILSIIKKLVVNSSQFLLFVAYSGVSCVAFRDVEDECSRINGKWEIKQVRSEWIQSNNDKASRGAADLFADLIAKPLVGSVITIYHERVAEIILKDRTCSTGFIFVNDNGFGFGGKDDTVFIGFDQAFGGFERLPLLCRRDGKDKLVSSDGNITFIIQRLDAERFRLPEKLLDKARARKEMTVDELLKSLRGNEP